MLAQFVWNWRSSIRVITSAERAQLLINSFVSFGGIGFQVAILGSRPSITSHHSPVRSRPLPCRAVRSNGSGYGSGWIWMGPIPPASTEETSFPFSVLPRNILASIKQCLRSCCELGTRRSWEGTIKRIRTGICQNASTWPASRQSTLERHRKKPARIFTKQHVHDVHENVWMHGRHGPAGPP